MVARVTYKRKHTYRTRSNQVRKFRTPGGKLSVQYTAKRNAVRVCGDTQVPLNGVPQLRNTKFARLSKRSRTITRAYGGSLSAEAVKHRIMRSFFNEELKGMKNATQAKKSKKKTQKKK
jgi:large subunit ribosomal protein L34e